MFTLSPLKRRIVYVSSFEVLAIILSTGLLMLLSGSSAQQSLPLAVLVSLAAVIWNYLYNTLFESWELRQADTTRTLRRRIAHALGFEGGLILICLPMYMLWYRVNLWQAFKMEIALLLFFLVYTFLFTLVFDRLFTLPGAASKDAEGMHKAPKAA